MTFKPLDNPIDYVILAGKRSPGICRVEGADSKRTWDERRGYGLTGARVIYKGTKLVRWKIILQLVTPAHWDEWEEWRPLVQRPPDGTRPRAMDIEHPILESQGVASAVVEEVSQPVQTEDGVWEVTIAMIEFRRPLPALAAPAGSQTRTTDPIDLEIERLTRQVQELAR